MDTSIPGYVANEASAATVLTIFFGACAIVSGSTNVVVKRLRPDLSRIKLLTAMWFALSSCVHLFFEGYYVLNVIDIGTHEMWFGQMWKAYASSDSRYLTQNAFIFCMESITSVAWGPRMPACGSAEDDAAPIEVSFAGTDQLGTGLWRCAVLRYGLL